MHARCDLNTGRISSRASVRRYAVQQLTQMSMKKSPSNVRSIQ